MAEILVDYGAEATAYVADSEYGDALSAAKELWRHDPCSLARFMKLLELNGWKEGKSGSDEDGPLVTGLAGILHTSSVKFILLYASTYIAFVGLSKVC